MGALNSLFEGYRSLFANINKAKTNNQDINVEGVISDEIPELNIDIDDDELIKNANKWKSDWEGHLKSDLAEIWSNNEKYWKGKQFDPIRYKTLDRPDQNNIIFEAEETYLADVTKTNPEPFVKADNTEQGKKLAGNITKMLQYQADRTRMKLKIKQVERFRQLYRLGCVKIAWSNNENDIVLQSISTKKLILDPTATIEDCEYRGLYVGEYRSDSIADLIKKFPKKKKEIEKLVNNKKNIGTLVQYVEWWTDDYVFWTLNDIVLNKAKNPHYNYEEEQETVNEFGESVKKNVIGKNHFTYPKKPYIFLCVYNLGERPYDETSQIEQVIPLQNIVNKRLEQIDKNCDNANGGMVVSGDYYTKEQADAAATTLRKGGVVWQSTGSPANGVYRDTGRGLPSDVFNQLKDVENAIRNVFGTAGSTPAGTKDEQTVRGKILIKSQDASRNGNIIDYIEQFCDGIFNYFVQMFYVYYDEIHSAAILGQEKSLEYITLSNNDLNRKLTVSVKEGSMIPDDPLTKRNTAVDLWGAGAIDPIALFDALDYPNPRESAEKLIQYKLDPMGYVQGANVQESIIQQQIIQQQQVKQPQKTQQNIPLDNIPVQ